ncbi:6-bladed beta-propeller [Gracilimonas sp.]|uniref:6-bladed beta-propeller n=1 Tax=Gracilimonas sp. TaxID=1974203 RepID=UPI002871F541|nr:6-bladed beta-propeller [Gracilimonas sp.]
MLRDQIIVSLILLLFTACNNKQSKTKTVERARTIDIERELVIGLENEADSAAQILGQPVGVVTDKEENIYIGDKASLTIKVFDKDGNYLKSLGGRGRGPNEFHDINFMGVTPENNILVLDRGNFRYTTITKEGEYVSNYVIKFENQFYFKDADFIDNKIIGLAYSQASAIESDYSDLPKREFLKIMSTDLDEIEYEFAPLSDLEIDDTFSWVYTLLYQGSFTLNKESEIIYFSPGIYTGSIYSYKKVNDVEWELNNKIEGTSPYSNPYILYHSTAEYEENSEYPSARMIGYSGDSHKGRVHSIDAGIHFLPQRRQVVHFYGEWREGDVSMEDGNLLDLSVQIFDLDGNIVDQSFLYSLPYDRQPYYPIVNWVDEEENFYMIDFIDSTPVVRRFALDL